MNSFEIIYKIKTASFQALVDHFNKSADSFNPPLYTYVVIKDYARKIFDNAMTFEAWDDEKLVGLAAVYFNNITEKIAFWTNLSVLTEYRKEGVALKLTSQVLDYGKTKCFKRIDLEVKAINKPIIRFHEFHGAKITGSGKGTLFLSYNLI